MRCQHSFHPNELGHSATAELLATAVAEELAVPPPAVAPDQPAATDEPPDEPTPVEDAGASYDIGDAFDDYCHNAWPTAPSYTTTQIIMTMRCDNQPQQYLFVQVSYPDPDLPVTPSTGRMRAVKVSRMGSPGQPRRLTAARPASTTPAPDVAYAKLVNVGNQAVQAGGEMLVQARSSRWWRARTATGTSTAWVTTRCPRHPLLSCGPRSDHLPVAITAADGAVLVVAHDAARAHLVGVTGHRSPVWKELPDGHVVPIAAHRLAVLAAIVVAPLALSTLHVGHSGMTLTKRQGLDTRSVLVSLRRARRGVILRS